ncbi:hypothetical protein FGO68_gene7565 [Halteria grandinella]|uniref:Uncharacterized protein n=1 Tax=Halteria grandinella TaxID=5974 RepID=A0A8J8NIR6_HALGN|nr:hypothetical protein FGO68_gene7565 [Halteria grandinella]
MLTPSTTILNLRQEVCIKPKNNTTIKQMCSITQLNQMKCLILNNLKSRYKNIQYQQIFPRKLIDTTVPVYPEPDYINQQEKNFNFKTQVNKMGGLINAIQRNYLYSKQQCSNICNKMNNDYF